MRYSSGSKRVFLWQSPSTMLGLSFIVLSMATLLIAGCTRPASSSVHASRTEAEETTERDLPWLVKCYFDDHKALPTNLPETCESLGNPNPSKDALCESLWLEDGADIICTEKVPGKSALLWYRFGTGKERRGGIVEVNLQTGEPSNWQKL